VDWATILAAIGRSQTGDRDGGRDALDACWAQTGPDDHAYRCVLAHYLADLQDSLDDEVTWDRTALEEYPRLDRDALVPVGIPDAAGLAPSLHLNLGDGYRRQGRPDAAAEQLALGQTAVGVLPDDGYGRMIREGLDRLADRLQSESPPDR
jgi:hypothetical protein